MLDEQLYEPDQPSALHIEKVSGMEVSLDSSNDADHEGRFNTLTDPDFDADDWEVSEEDLEKVRLLLKEREVPLDIPPSKARRRFCKSHRKFRKQAEKAQREKRKQEGEEELDTEHFVLPPNFPWKNEYLYYVEAQDCVKDEVKWRHGFQHVKKLLDTKGGNHKKKK